MPVNTAATHPSPTQRILALGRTILIAAGIVLVLLVSLTALRSSFGLVRLPIELVLLDEHLPCIFRVHMAASGLALGFGFVTLLVRHAPWAHRPLGLITAVLVAMGGLTALPSALYSEATAVARAGFFAQGCVWLALLGSGLAAIRARDVTRHRRAMLAMYAVASGAIWLRLATAAIASFDIPFATGYVLAAWLSWSIPLSLVWCLMSPAIRFRLRERGARAVRASTH